MAVKDVGKPMLVRGSFDLLYASFWGIPYLPPGLHKFKCSGTGPLPSVAGRIGTVLLPPEARIDKRQSMGQCLKYNGVERQEKKPDADDLVGEA